MAEDTDIRVAWDDAQSRYEIFVGDTLGGFTEVEPDAHGRAAMPHTEIDPAFKGRGLGTILARDALADLAQRGETVVPHCSFIAKYLRENEVAGLVVDWPHPPAGQEG